MAVRGQLSHFDATAGTFRVELPKEMPLGKTIKILSKGGEVFFNIDFESSRVLFRTALHFFDDEKHLLEFKIPAQIYRIQERNFPRLDTRKNPAIAAFHLDPHPLPVELPSAATSALDPLNHEPVFDELDPSPLPLPPEGYVPLEAPRGTLVLLDGLLPHWSAANRSTRSRVAYSLHVIDAAAHYPADNWLRRSPDMPLRGF